MRAEFRPSEARGSVRAPSSKSSAHRLLICAGLSNGCSRIAYAGNSEDIKATMDCLKALGAEVTREGSDVLVRGSGLNNTGSSAVLNCRESGSTLRFFIPICLLTDRKMTLLGSGRLLARPMDVYKQICADQKLFYDGNEERIIVKGRLSAGEYRVKGNISSQFITGLLFALPLLEEDSTIRLIPPVESRSYIDLTLQAQKRFGIEVDIKDANTFEIKGGQVYVPGTYEAEGDYSNAAFLSAFNLCGGNVEVTGLDPASLQGDKVYSGYFRAVREGCPVLDISNCPDLGPVLFAVSALHSGGTFTGTDRLKIKESDRGAAMKEELEKFGVRVEIGSDVIRVVPEDLHAPSGILDGHNDHRIVMALSVLCSVTGGCIEGAEASRKSFPDFFSIIKQLGVEVSLNGMDQ